MKNLELRRMILKENKTYWFILSTAALLAMLFANSLPPQLPKMSLRNTTIVFITELVFGQIIAFICYIQRNKSHRKSIIQWWKETEGDERKTSEYNLPLWVSDYLETNIITSKMISELE